MGSTPLSRFPRSILVLSLELRDLFHSVKADKEASAGVHADPVGAMAAAVAAHLHRTLHIRRQNALAEKPPPPGFPPAGIASDASVAARINAIRVLLAASTSSGVAPNFAIASTLPLNPVPYIQFLDMYIQLR